MDELEDLDTYNGDVIHDMYVDMDYEIYTGELPEVFDGEDDEPEDPDEDENSEDGAGDFLDFLRNSRNDL